MAYVPIIIVTNGSIASSIGALLGVLFAWGTIFTIYGIHFSRPYMKGAKWEWDKKTITIGMLLNLAGIIGLLVILSN